MIKWITACFQATMDFLCGKIEDPKPEQKVEDLKKEVNEKWVSQQERKGFTVPSQRMSEKVKTLDNSKSPKTIVQRQVINNNSSGIQVGGNVYYSDYNGDLLHVNTHDWSEPERTSSNPSYESSSSGSYDSSSSSSYDSFGGGSSDGGGSSSDW